MNRRIIAVVFAVAMCLASCGVTADTGSAPETAAATTTAATTVKTTEEAETTTETSAAATTEETAAATTAEETAEETTTTETAAAEPDDSEETSSGKTVMHGKGYSFEIDEAVWKKVNTENKSSELEFEAEIENCTVQLYITRTKSPTPDDTDPIALGQLFRDQSNESFSKKGITMLDSDIEEITVDGHGAFKLSLDASIENTVIKSGFIGIPKGRLVYMIGYNCSPAGDTEPDIDMEALLDSFKFD